MDLRVADKSFRKTVPYTLLALAISIIPGARVMSAAELPTSPGVGFAMVGVVPGQTVRLIALNAGPGGPALPSGVAPGSCGGGVTFEFYGVGGELLKKTVINNLEPGKAAFLDLSHNELPKGAARTQVRAVLRFGYDRGYPPDRETRARFECNLLPSLEIFENATGKTTLVLTDAKPLPESSSPRK
jgi:hypothetical protein